MVQKPLLHQLLIHSPSNQLCTEGAKKDSFTLTTRGKRTSRIQQLRQIYLMLTEHVQAKEEVHVGRVKDYKRTRVEHIPNLSKSIGNWSEAGQS